MNIAGVLIDKESRQKVGSKEKLAFGERRTVRRAVRSFVHDVSEFERQHARYLKGVNYSGMRGKYTIGQLDAMLDGLQEQRNAIVSKWGKKDMQGAIEASNFGKPKFTFYVSVAGLTVSAISTIARLYGNHIGNELNDALKSLNAPENLFGWGLLGGTLTVLVAGIASYKSSGKKIRAEKAIARLEKLSAKKWIYESGQLA